jgi:hydroxymethylglutaryl-CoA lyase
MAVKLIECPRDAMQGIHEFIPTSLKIEYIQSLLSVNFDILDCVSFVSPKAIPQLRDSAEVLNGLDLSNTKTELLAIIANTRGAREAITHEKITYLGFPFSVSQEFQKRNTNSTMEESFDRVKEIQELCERGGKRAVVYISMGFGNPYGEEWNEEIVEHWVDKIQSLGIEKISLSDTIGVAKPKNISTLFSHLIPRYSNIDFGAHFHTRPNEWKEKIDAAYESGCLRYDGAIKGYGGCPMADDELTGNMPMENLVHYFDGIEDMKIKQESFFEALKASIKVFS